MVKRKGNDENGNGDSETPSSKHRRYNPKATRLPSPEKSNSDSKNYRLIQLDNGLRCLLISDSRKNNNPLWAQKSYNEGAKRLKTTGCCSSFACEGLAESNGLNMATEEKVETRAAFCLIIQAGGADDPRNCQGMAHFTEHMLHYGSRKYPGEGEYMNFIKSFGDHVNAYTQILSTAYQCSVDPNFLPTALDIFSNIVTYPSFDANCAEREVHSVDSEFYLRKNDQINQMVDIIKQTLPEKHPLNSFICGNATTLKGNLKSSLQAFHKEHYVGNKMTFAIQSTAQLDSLQELVEKYMSNIPAGKVVNKPKTEDLKPYYTFEFTKLYKLKGEPTLCLVWQFPPEVWKNFDAKPLEVLTAVMNDGREGSLKHYLHQQGLIYKLYSDSYKSDEFQNRYATLYFSLFALTPEGVRHVNKVVQSVFAYIDVIRKAPLESKQRVWEELRKAAEANYDHIGDGSPLNNTHFGARSLINSPTGKDIFNSQLLFQDEFDNKVFSDLIKSIKAEETLFIQHVTELTGKTQKSLPYTNFPYNVSSIPKEFKSNVNFHLRFPAENPYVTDRFEIEDYTKPYRVWKPKLHLEHRAIEGLTIPKAFIQISLISTKDCKLPLEPYMLSMLCNNISLAMDCDVSCASRSGLSSSVNCQTFNSKYSIIYLQVVGFSEFMPEIVKSFCKGFSKQNSTKIQKNIFEQLKTSEMNHYNETLNSNSHLLTALLQRITTADHVNEIDSDLTPDDIAPEEFENFISKFRASMKIVAVMEGNISKENVKYIEALIGQMEYEPMKNDSTNHIPAAFSLADDDRVVRIRRKHPEDFADENNRVVNLYQLAASGRRDYAIAKIVTHLMRGRVFQELRTNEQLGYSLYSGGPQNIRLPVIFYIDITTPRSKHTPCHVSKRVDNFLITFFNEHLSQMTDKEYNDTLRKAHLENTTYISLDEVKSWYQQNVSNRVPANGNRFTSALKKLSVQIISSAKKGSKSKPKNCDCPICQSLEWVEGDNPLVEFAQIDLNSKVGKGKPPADYFISDISEYHDTVFR